MLRIISIDASGVSRVAERILPMKCASRIAFCFLLVLLVSPMVACGFATRPFQIPIPASTFTPAATSMGAPAMTPTLPATPTPTPLPGMASPTSPPMTPSAELTMLPNGAPTITPTPIGLGTMTPTPSEVPNVIPTVAPTMNPTPMGESTVPSTPPDLSGAVLSNTDLPAGFLEIPVTELGMKASDFGTEGLKAEAVSVFVKPIPFQVVIGANFLLADSAQRVYFDASISPAEVALSRLVADMKEVRDAQVLQGLEDIGDSQLGMSMVATIGGIPSHVEILLFRRDVIAGMIFFLGPKGMTPEISIHDLGVNLDGHFQETLKAMP
jgi:hypothetical protein